METVNQNKKQDIYVVIGFVLLSLLSIFWRIRFGWDQDESYNILLAQRIADGKIIFKDMWDLHQTAAIFPSVFCKAYVGVMKTTDGIAIFLRVMSVIIQLLVAVYTFFVIKRYYGEKCAFGAGIVVANLLPRATQETEYSTVAVWGCLICSLLLFEVKRQKGNYLKIIIAAVFYSMAVYAYPTLAISVPFVAFLFIFVISEKRLEGVKYGLVFCAVCIAAAGMLFAYLFSHMSVSEFMSIIAELGKNDDHGGWFRAFSPQFIIKSGARIVATIIPAAVLKVALNKIRNVNVPLVYLYVLFTTLFVILLNLTGIRPSGPFGLLERYIATVILAVFIGINESDRDFVWILGGMGIAVYLGVLMGSNLGLNENAMFLELSIICLTVLCIKKLQEFSGKQLHLSEISIYLFIFGIVFTSGYFVRIDSTKPANAFQCISTMTSGPLKGIGVFPEQKERFDALSASAENITEEGKLYTLLTNDAITYYSVKGDYISAQYAKTGQYYNEQWVDFYTKFGRELPDEILVNKYNYPELAPLYEKEFGKWVNSEYTVNDLKTDDVFWVLERKGN